MVVHVPMLSPDDERTHAVGPEGHFNESMYANCTDPSSGIGVFLRVGNRPNERYAEVTACAALPDGRVAFFFHRPEIAGNGAFDAGGARFAVIEPFSRIDVGYDGPAIVLDDPGVLDDPAAAFASHPTVPCAIRLACSATSLPFGSAPAAGAAPEAPGEEFARGHYEQLLHATGILRVGDEEWAIQGEGLRDHSWGPRHWQAPWYYRWLTANFGASCGLMATEIVRRDGATTQAGFVFDAGALHLVHGVEIETEWDGDARQRVVHATLRSGAGGDGGRTWRLDGTVRTVVPLRNRRKNPETGEEMLTRIAEGFTTWTLDGERSGHGLSEYLDQVVDGVPVGARAASSSR